MDVWQRGTSFPTQFDAPNHISYGADRWRDQNDSSFPADGSVERSTDAPSNMGFRYSEKVTCTGNTALTSNDYAMITQLIEAQNARPLQSATHATLSFWVKANYTGKHSFNFGVWNASSQVERYHTRYDINTTNTWEKKVITVPLNTSNPIAQHSDTVQGFDCVFVLGTDSARQWNANLDAWQTTEVRSAISQSDCKNFFDTVGNTFQITGVQLELGDTATDFEHRSYGEELALCQRYFEVLQSDTSTVGGTGVHWSSTTGGHYMPVTFQTPKRVIPSILYSTGNVFYSFYSAAADIVSMAGSGSSTTRACELQFTANNTVSFVRGISGNDCFIHADAEL